MRQTLKIALVAMVSAAGLVATPTYAKEAKVYTSVFSKVAVSGYDTVAYFTDGKPVKGDKKFTYSWNGADWQFASAEHRDLFAANPEKYAPQYGGYCAYAVSQNYTASADPTSWRIYEGKLYLNYNADVQKRWEGDIKGFVADADKHWPSVTE